MPKINFEAKTDRELLILAVQQGNATAEHLAKLNHSIQKHESRIVALETCQKEWRPFWKHPKEWGPFSLMIVALSLGGNKAFDILHRYLGG